MSYYIYKICCDDCPDFVYVGSTKAFRHRKSQHKQDCKTKDYKLYNTIRENGGWNNWRMVILEDCGEITLTQARIKEEEHRVKLNSNLNMRKCHQTEEEKKERNNLYSKERRNDNLEFFRNKDKEYYENNVEQKLEYAKEYREKNKEKINEYKMQRVTCECGRTYGINDKGKHINTKIHKKLIEEKNNINII
jgi:hypothetical protein